MYFKNPPFGVGIPKTNQRDVFFMLDFGLVDMYHIGKKQTYIKSYQTPAIIRQSSTERQACLRNHKRMKPTTKGVSEGKEREQGGWRGGVGTRFANPVQKHEMEGKEPRWRGHCRMILRQGS